MTTWLDASLRGTECGQLTAVRRVNMAEIYRWNHQEGLLAALA
jgi:hypothetical protein